MNVPNRETSNYHQLNWVRFSRRKVVLFIFTLFFTMLPAANAHACEDQNLQQAKQIIEQVWILGQEIGYGIGMGTVDPMVALQYMIQELQRINQATLQLPQSCQALVQQWASSIEQAMGGGGGGGGPNCMGSVCCDHQGCF